MKIEKRKFSRPAILLGNGLNNHVLKNSSWIRLLNGLVHENIPKSYFEEGGLSYPEFFDAVSFLNGKGNSDYHSLKETICNKIATWEGTNGHHALTEFARGHSIPIITTNYDLTLVDIKIKRTMKKKFDKSTGALKPIIPIKPNYKFTDFYPWHTHYSDCIIFNAPTQFAIWYMHGIACYKRSLSIGAIDYGNNISRYKMFLSDLKKKDMKKWIGKNSWLDIFLHCDLIVIGLSLESQETSLRWLLMEREKYFRKKPAMRRYTAFVINKQHDKLGEGKKFFLNALGIEIIEKANESEIYDSWEFS